MFEYMNNNSRYDKVLGAAKLWGRTTVMTLGVIKAVELTFKTRIL